MLFSDTKVLSLNTLTIQNIITICPENTQLLNMEHQIQHTIVYFLVSGYLFDTFHFRIAILIHKNLQKTILIAI